MMCRGLAWKERRAYLGNLWSLLRQPERGERLWGLAKEREVQVSPLSQVHPCRGSCQHLLPQCYLAWVASNFTCFTMATHFGLGVLGEGR